MRLPKLRLHLLTCVVLMFVAGALIWANLKVRPLPYRLIFVDGPLVHHRRGWPLDLPLESYPGIPPPVTEVTVFNFEMLINLLVAMVFISLSALVCEVSIRRSGRSRGEQ